MSSQRNDDFSLAALPPLRPYQRAVARAVRDSVRAGDGRTFSVMVARQGGKNELSAQLEVSFLHSHANQDLDAVKCAPTFSPQVKLSLRRLWSRLHAARPLISPALESGYIVRLGRARQVFLSAEPGANVAGHTCHTLLEVDEAQDVDPEKFDKDFRPMASTTNATTVYYGTAWSETDLLAQVKARHLELERQDGIRRHFEFDWRHVARFNPAYARFVEGERLRLGEDHPLFQSQYCLRPLPGGGRLFSPAQLTLLEGAHERERTPSRSSGVLGYVAGLDIGGEAFDGNRQSAIGNRGGPDRTVLTIARVLTPDPHCPLPIAHCPIEVLDHVAWEGAPHTELIGALARLLRDIWRVRRLVVDATGLGEGLAGSLAALRNGPEVVRLRLTEARKSQLGYALLAAVNGGRLSLYRADGSPEARLVREECARARAIYRPNRTLAFAVDPADGHDDFLISLALTVEAAAGLVPRVARGRLEDGAAW
ncbi:MAG: hypothetical protein AB7R89_29650 [Dehalococcoidia bacterium]